VRWFKHSRDTQTENCLEPRYESLGVGVDMPMSPGQDGLPLGSLTAATGNRMFPEASSLSSTPSGRDEQPMKVDIKVKNTFIDVQDDPGALDICNRRSSRNKTEPARLPVHDVSDDEDDGATDGTVSLELSSHHRSATCPGACGGSGIDLPPMIADPTPDHTTRLAMQASMDGASPFHVDEAPLSPGNSGSENAGGVVSAMRGYGSEGLPGRSLSSRRQVMVTFPIDIPEGMENLENVMATVTNVLSSQMTATGGVVMDLRVLVGSPPPSLLAQPSSAISFKGGSCSAPVSSFRADLNAAAAKTEVKNVTVCCHWKNKGFCKLGDGCKFMHPPNKQGVGSTRRKGDAALAEARAAGTSSTNARRQARGAQRPSAKTPPGAAGFGQVEAVIAD